MGCINKKVFFYYKVNLIERHFLKFLSYTFETIGNNTGIKKMIILLEFFFNFSPACLYLITPP